MKLQIIGKLPFKFRQDSYFAMKYLLKNTHTYNNKIIFFTR